MSYISVNKWKSSKILYKVNVRTSKANVTLVCVSKTHANPSDHTAYSVGLLPLAGWNCGFESCQECVSLGLVSIMWYQLEVCVMSPTLTQRIPLQHVLALSAKVTIYSYST
jgi:hypothetical protein